MGPATDDPKVIDELIGAGMDVVRINAVPMLLGEDTNSPGGKKGFRGLVGIQVEGAGQGVEVP